MGWSTSGIWRSGGGCASCDLGVGCVLDGGDRLRQTDPGQRHGSGAQRLDNVSRGSALDADMMPRSKVDRKENGLVGRFLGNAFDVFTILTVSTGYPARNRSQIMVSFVWIMDLWSLVYGTQRLARRS